MTAPVHKTLAEALVAAQADMPPVDKDKKANYGMYTTIDNLIAKTRQHLQKYGLVISQWPDNIDGAPALTTRITHVSGESFHSTMPLLVDASNMQKLGAAITYARRYAWAAALGISDQDDDDGKHASEPEVDKPAAKSAQAAAGTPRVSNPRAATAPSDAVAAPPPMPKGLKACQEQFESLTRTLNKVDPEFDVAGALKSMEGKDEQWLWRAGERLKERIAQASTVAEQFPVPERAKAKAA